MMKTKAPMEAIQTRLLRPLLGLPKAALEAVTKKLALAGKRDGVRVLSVHPGWFSSDMGGPKAPLTPEQIELIKKTVAKGATDDELELFAHVCNRTGLDPFARQIYAIKRRQKNEANEWVENMVFQVSIDGFRLIAERSGKYRGQTPPVFYDKAGNEREVWLDPKTPPSACKIGAHRAGAVEPLWGIAVFDEFKQTKYGGELTKMWKEKPSVMIAKCAEATALRKAFPQELSGLYIHEEMEPTEEEPTEARDRQVSK